MKHIFDSIKGDKYLITIPFLTLSVRLIIFLFIPHTYEDAYITFRYAENFANGDGLVYNIGERVYGTTTPLFAIILGLLNFIGVSTIVSSLLINLIAEGITSLIIYTFLKELSYKIAGIVSLLFVFSPSNISWSIQGMETAFFSSIIALAFFTLYKKKYFLSLLFGFLSAMIRIDGLSVTFVIILICILEIRSSILKQLFLPLILFIAWLTFLYIYFGNFIPNSMIAKLILYSGHQDSIIPNLHLVFSKFFTLGYYSSSILTLLFLAGVLIIIKKKLKFYPMVIWIVIYYSALIFSKTNIHGWYLIPPLFVYIAISGISIIYIIDFIQKKIPLNKNIIYAVLLSGILFFSIVTIYLKISQISLEYQYEQNVRKKVGQFINYSTPKNSTVFLEPIGVIGYYSDRYIYDDAGLVSPIFLEFNKLPYNAISRYKKIQYVKPDYLVLRNIYLEEFYLKTNLLKDYVAVKSFEFNLRQDHIVFSPLTVFQRINN